MMPNYVPTVEDWREYEAEFLDPLQERVDRETETYFERLEIVIDDCPLCGAPVRVGQCSTKYYGRYTHDMCIVEHEVTPDE